MIFSLHFPTTQQPIDPYWLSLASGVILASTPDPSALPVPNPLLTPLLEEEDKYFDNIETQSFIGFLDPHLPSLIDESD